VESQRHPGTEPCSVEAKTAWFEDPSSASSRPHTHLNKPSTVPGISIGPCGIITANGTETQGLNAFKEFNMETDHAISLLIYCQVGKDSNHPQRT
jgi:hypothetical protein